MFAAAEMSQPAFLHCEEAAASYRGPFGSLNASFPRWDRGLSRRIHFWVSATCRCTGEGRQEFGWRKGSIALTQLAELHSMDATWTEREMKCAEWFMLKILLWLILLEAQSLKIEHRLLKRKKCPQDSSAKLRQTFTDVSLRWFNIIYNTGCLTCRPCFLSKRLLKLLCSLFAPKKHIVLDLYSFLLEVFTCNTSLTSVFKKLSHTLQPKSTFKPENLDWIWKFIKLQNSL